MTGRSRHWRGPAPSRLMMLAVALLVGLAGCQQNRRIESAPATASTPTYTGPDYLRGTIGSLCRLRNYDPLLVSGYGVVVFPPGTKRGSSEVPAFLEKRLTNHIQKLGMGSDRMRKEVPDRFEAFMHMSPQRFLYSRNTTVVAVQGFIPAGGVAGTRFDVLVSAIDSQTTSLTGGTLWTTELSIAGTNREGLYTRTLARAYGPIYKNPFEAVDTARGKAAFQRQGAVISGGVVSRDQPVQLVLNTPSWVRSQRIADRINERFPAAPDERYGTASAKSNLLIRLHIPRRYQADPGRLVSLIAHQFLPRGPEFAPREAERLARVLGRTDDSEVSRRVGLAWQAMGKTVLPTLRKYYGDQTDLGRRLAALEAGARLEDGRTIRYLLPLIDHPEPSVRRRMARALVHLPASLRGNRALRKLLDDSNQSVRIAAYEALASMHHRIIDRAVLRGPTGVKFLIDRVPADRPLVYVAQTEGVPRVVIFGKRLGLSTPAIARVWNNDLMIRAREEKPLSVYYKKPDRIQGDKYKVRSDVASLVYMLGHSPSSDRPDDGLGLPYSRVVDAIYQLCRQGAIPAPIEVHESRLARLVRQAEQEKTPDRRPVTDPTGAADETAAGDAPTPAAPATPATLGARPGRDGLPSPAPPIGTP